MALKINIETTVSNTELKEINEIICASGLCKDLNELETFIHNINEMKKFESVKYGFGGSHFWVSSLFDLRILFITEN